MIISMKPGATEEEVAAVTREVEAHGLFVHPIKGVERTVLGVRGDPRGRARADEFASLPGVDAVIPISTPYKLASRAGHPEPTVVEVGQVRIGGPEMVMIAGPCTVETEEQTLAAATAVRAAGACILRGDAFKPRTSPYSFQGLGEPGLRILRKAGDALGMPVMAEVVDPADAEMVAEYADILRVGTRNVQNFPLLRRLGRLQRPILLKRGFASTLEELLLAAEYMLLEGNPNVVLCERGIRTFEPSYRNTFDVTAIPVLKELSHLPVIADPSHAAGRRKCVPPVALAAAAAGADGLLVDVHPQPQMALCDGPQALLPEEFKTLMEQLKAVARGVGRPLAELGAASPTAARAGHASA